MRRHLGALAVSGACLFGIAAAPVAAAPCPNESLRQEQSTHLSECRAYEQVSPVDKAGNAVDRTKTVQSAPGGGGVAYSAPGAFPGAPTSLTGQYYIGRRSSSGWSTEAIDAPQLNFTQQIATPSLWLTSDLGRTMQFSQFPAAAGAIAGGGNLFLRDNLTGERTTALANPAGNELGNQLVPFTNRYPIWASDDLSRFFFNTTVQLVPEASPGRQNAYEIANGHLSLVDVMPDGTISPEGGSLGGAPGSNGVTPPPAASADGSRVFFQSPNTQDFPFSPLYLREDGQTIPISVSQRSGDSSEPRDATFMGTNRAGAFVYFTSRAPLTEDAEEGGAYGDLYRYEVETGALVNLTADNASGLPAEVIDVLGFADDGSTVYFKSVSPLTPNAPGQAIYVAKEGSLHLVGSSTENSAEVAMSPSGRYFAFVSWDSDNGYDNSAATTCPHVEGLLRPAGLCEEVYVYDSQTDHLSCASCDPVDGANYNANLAGGSLTISSYVPRVMLDDGSVYFDSDARLVAADVNGRKDVYRWKDGGLTLISPGRRNFDATLADVSASGADVFFMTAQPIVAQDSDEDVDLYTARVDGGLAAQNPVPAAGECGGEGCQPAGVPAAAAPAAGSAAFVGPPNAKPRRKVVRKKQRKRHGAHKRHHRRHKSKSAEGKRGGNNR